MRRWCRTAPSAGAGHGVEHWTLVRAGNARASMQVDNDSGPSKALPYSVKLTVEPRRRAVRPGLSNAGYWGMAVQPHTAYHGSFYAKVDDDAVGPVTARLINDRTGAVLAEAKIPLHGGEWSSYEYTLTTAAHVTPSRKNHLQLTVAHPGTCGCSWFR